MAPIELGPWSLAVGVQTPALPLKRCVTLNTLVPHSVLYFLHL